MIAAFVHETVLHMYISSSGQESHVHPSRRPRGGRTRPAGGTARIRRSFRIQSGGRHSPPVCSRQRSLLSTALSLHIQRPSYRAFYAGRQWRWHPQLSKQITLDRRQKKQSDGHHGLNSHPRRRGQPAAGPPVCDCDAQLRVGRLMCRHAGGK
jgi:hypothetical protein